MIRRNPDRIVNVPTDLLRALTAVVDFRSYTKAAQFLGMSQPAVSAQIKRLHELLGCELFDRNSPRVTLSARGELVVNYARRLLIINDQIVQATSPEPDVRRLEIGIPSDFVGTLMPAALESFRGLPQDLRFHIRSDISDNLLRAMRQGHYDLCVALTLSTPAVHACRYWSEEVVWVGRADVAVDPSVPVPLITYSDSCVYGRLAASSLSRAGRDHEIVFTGSNIDSLGAAVGAGLGVMALARRVVPPHLTVCADGQLPKLPDLVCGVYIREGVEDPMLEQLVDGIAGAIRPNAEWR